MRDCEQVTKQQTILQIPVVANTTFADTLVVRFYGAVVVLWGRPAGAGRNIFYKYKYQYLQTPVLQNAEERARPHVHAGKT